ncbi:aldose 1-epimerase [Nocardioides psychrotolerans]|uniref:Aldose 1-epimerase n=1 Tax=Nocardioides psychrotolerans TaxID=1005945 RepID=A0A1I3E1Q9_9ACTN|nr:aldose epimerase family protein [Nocardioides psychrotolerans]GEP37548.1 aldose 1-epimerase [Nocardioides psychrotolerans]SFH92907.1 aldose 1-epimerase [Nocardioides psychrotolerans]
MPTPLTSIVIGREPGPVLHVLPLGATVQRLDVGRRARRNVVLGHATTAEYLASVDFVGGTIGRYANRIARGRFEVDGVEHAVVTNDRGNALHGGPDGFHRRVWDVVSQADDEVVLALESPDGDQGFPGQVSAQVRYAVVGDTVVVELTATTDAPTLVNLTQHTYFALGGVAGVPEHELRVAADRYTPTDATGIPLGEHAPVGGTPFDLRSARRLGEVGIDHHYVLEGHGLRPVAELACRRTGMAVVVSTDQPGLQVYTGRGFDGSRRSLSDEPLGPYAGIALEPQLAPDSPHHEGPDWPSAVLRPGETYRSVLEWRFVEA